MDKEKVLAVGASYARSYIAATLALYLAGVTDPKVLLHAGLAALAPIILRAVNPKDKAFGVIGK